MSLTTSVTTGSQQCMRDDAVNRVNFGFIATVVCSFGLLLLACTQVWYFTIVDPADFDHPVFCFSRKPECKGDPVQFGSFDFAEVDESGKYVSVVWRIEGTSKELGDYDLKKVRYGDVPQGWVSRVGPLPLVAGKIYTVEERYFFTLRTQAGKTTWKVYSRSDFYGKFRP